MVASVSIRACSAAPAKARSRVSTSRQTTNLAGAADRYGDDMSCVFCAIVAGQAPAIRIYEDDGYLAFLDIRPFTRGHTLVVPKQHTVDLTDTPPETLADMMTIGQRIAREARA